MRCVYNAVMRYIICAFKGEAHPLINHFNLTRTTGFAYPLYQNENTLLIITHMGYENALMATSALLGYRPPEPDDLLINVGICAAPKSFEIGELIVIHKISYNAHDLYPMFLVKHPFMHSALISVDTVQSTMQSLPVDMEAHAIFKASARFMPSDQMLFIKIVSDHFDPKSVNKNAVTRSIQAHLSNIEMLMA